MRFRLLGNVEIRSASTWVRPERPRRRAVLAYLLLAPNRTVTVRELTEALWGALPPATARSQVQNDVAAIRKALVDAGHPAAIVTRTGGYELVAEPDDVDYLVFYRLATSATAAMRRADWPGAADDLRAALALWRGSVLGDVDAAFVEPTRARLEEQRLDTVERLAEVCITIGENNEQIPILREIVAEHPERERPAALLMLALHGAGRRADALAVARDLREHLREEHGLDPSQAVVEMERRILRDTPVAVDSSDAADGADPRPLAVRALVGPAAQPPEPTALTGDPAPPPSAPDGVPPVRTVVPRQLPSALTGFAGRAAELAVLDELVPVATALGAAVAVVSGTGGVGKSTLAVHWANRVRSRFPDGELFVNLRGYDADGSPVDPYAAIRGFLEALGVGGKEVPADPDGQVGLYRSLLAGRRMLILADNARDAAQVLPLIPGAPGCLVLVTSRDRLESLVVVNAAVSVPLALLSVEESRQLLGERLGATRLDDEPDAVDEIIEACAQLPLALAITAGRATVHTGYSLEALAKDLTDAAGALDALSGTATQVDVRAVLSWSYRLLDSRTARLFRQLSLYPGPDIEVTGVASLAGIPVAEARRLLRELTGGNLLEETQPDRFAFHDLLREYAAEQAASHDSAEEIALAYRRLLDHYVLTAKGAMGLMLPRPTSDTFPPSGGVSLVPLEDVAAAVAWFSREWVVLRDAIGQATRLGFDAHVWRLAHALARYFERQGTTHDWIATQQAGLAAAERLGDPLALGSCLVSAGVSYGATRDYARAEPYLRRAIRVLEEIGDVFHLPRAHHNLSVLLMETGRLHEALRHSAHSRKLYADIHDAWGLVTSLNTTGDIHTFLGNHHKTVTWCRRALETAEKNGLGWKAAYVWDTLGSAHHQLGETDEAERCFQKAIDTACDGKDRYAQAWALRHYGELLLATAPEAAHKAWQEAIGILEEMRHPAADEIRAQLLAA